MMPFAFVSTDAYKGGGLRLLPPLREIEPVNEALCGRRDGVRIYSIGADGFARSEVIGTTVAMPEDADYWLV